MADRTAFTWNHLLYRLFDADGALLYIGRTGRFPSRMSGHAGTQPWWPEVVRATVETLPSFDALADAERRAIRAENPRYNAIRYTPPVPRPEDERPARAPRTRAPKAAELPTDDAVIVRPVDAICASGGRVAPVLLSATLGVVRSYVAGDLYDSTRSVVEVEELARDMRMSVPKAADAVGHLVRSGWLLDHGAGVYDYSIPKAVFDLGLAACTEAADCMIHGGERGEVGPVAPIRVA